MAEYDPRTALIVVDMQNDFADPQGALYVRGGEQVVPVANAEIAKARAAGALVVYTQDWHPPSTPHFAKDGGIWPVHCVRDSWGAGLHPDLVVAGAVVRTGLGSKDGYSGFEERDAAGGAGSKTPLEDLLRRRGIERLVVLGLATDYCVRATALDGLARGFPTVVLADGVRPVDLAAGDGERALDELRHAGATIE
ncbi:MAG TPA: isochorismatase family protein [Thermoanaerobaculia bacterium]|jgi:nicotinamidase/pyrazinamidase|nr:isochorismatase family protein [Thermoanaerobaculia bacterium]